MARVRPDGTAQLLRALERLRSGLPPDEIAGRISVGVGHIESAARALLRQSAEDGRRALAVLGPYGAGKTHALTLLRDLAREEGYATCWLSADSAEGALNHHQRCVPSLLATMEFGGIGGYTSLLTSVLEQEKHLLQLAAILAEEMGEDNRIGVAALSLTIALLSARSEHTTADLHSARDRLVQLLSGEVLAGLPATDNVRVTAYRLLAVAARLVVLAGASGLLVVIDEVESVFTKIGNRLSRRGALRSLSALLDGIGAPSLRFVLGMTPDTWQGLRDTWREHALSTPCARFEDMRSFGATLDGITALNCEKLSPEQMLKVLALVRELHLQCYGTEIPAEDWTALLADVLGRRPPMRVAIRSALDHLDLARFGRAGLSGAAFSAA